MESFKGAGYFWDIDNEAGRRPGVIRFSETKGIRIDLVGALNRTLIAMRDGGWSKNGATNIDFDEGSKWTLLRGRVKNEAITVLEAQGFPTIDFSDIAGEYSLEVVRARAILKGRFWCDPDTQFKRITARVSGLFDWVGLSGIESKFQFDPQVFSTQLSHLDSIEVTLHDGVQLSIEHSSSASPGSGETALKESFQVEMRSEAGLTIEDWLDLLFDFRALITVGVGTESFRQELRFFEPIDTGEDAGKGKADAEPAAVAATDSLLYGAALRDLKTYRQLDDRRHRQVVFRLRDTDGADFVARWMDVAGRHRKPLLRLLGTRPTRMFSTDRMMNSVGALERLDVEAGNAGYLALRTRLHRRVEQAGPLGTKLVRNRQRWSALVKKYRDDSAHHLTDIGAEDPYGYETLAGSCYWLLVLDLLVEANAPQKVFDEIEKSTEFTTLKSRVSAMLDSATNAANPSATSQ